MNNSTNLSSTNIKQKAEDSESSNISSFWYNFSTLTAPLDDNNIKTLQKVNPNGSSRFPAHNSFKFRKNLMLYQTVQKQSPKTYKTIYENRQIIKNSQ